jgi:hypothetical protein
MLIEVKSVTGEVLFSHEEGNNSLKKAVISAIIKRVDLSGANLSGANLSGANLSGANLSEADLRWANLSRADLSGANLNKANLSEADLRWANLSEADLRWANLSGANLSGANLSEADLRWANLSRADLSGADLRWSIGNMKEISSLQLETYYITMTKERIFIGCRGYSVSEWKNFNDDEISKMDSSALSFWKKWKNFIFKAHKLHFGV